MKKMLRQPKPAMSSPPTTGPADSATLAPAAHSPTARLRPASSGKAWLSRASEQAPRSAAPAPWTARAAISTGMSGARPQAIDAATNTTKPTLYTRRAPNRSPSAPPERIRAANINV